MAVKQKGETEVRKFINSAGGLILDCFAVFFSFGNNRIFISSFCFQQKRKLALNCYLHKYKNNDRFFVSKIFILILSSIRYLILSLISIGLIEYEDLKKLRIIHYQPYYRYCKIDI